MLARNIMSSKYSYRYLSLIYDECKSTFWEDYKLKLKPYLNSDSTVLDLGCGTGLAIDYLQIPTENYFGIDLSKEMLEIAQEKNPKHDFKLESITKLNLNKSFDVIIMVFDTLNHLLSEQDWIQAFRVAYSHLKPSGYFIFDVVTPFDHEEVWSNHIDITESEKWLYIQRSHFNKLTRRATLKTTIFFKKNKIWSRYDESIEQISFDVNDILEMLTHVGFQCEACLDSNTGKDYHTKSNSVMFVSKKH
jgi:SAM-dependent methyltransferase